MAALDQKKAGERIARWKTAYDNSIGNSFYFALEEDKAKMNKPGQKKVIVYGLKSEDFKGLHSPNGGLNSDIKLMGLALGLDSHHSSPESPNTEFSPMVMVQKKDGQVAYYELIQMDPGEGGDSQTVHPLGSVLPPVVQHSFMEQWSLTPPSALNDLFFVDAANGTHDYTTQQKVNYFYMSGADLDALKAAQFKEDASMFFYMGVDRNRSPQRNRPYFAPILTFAGIELSHQSIVGKSTVRLGESTASYDYLFPCPPTCPPDD